MMHIFRHDTHVPADTYLSPIAFAEEEAARPPTTRITAPVMRGVVRGESSTRPIIYITGVVMR